MVLGEIRGVVIAWRGLGMGTRAICFNSRTRAKRVHGGYRAVDLTCIEKEFGK
jgi:hypothetical protein